jgi:hypothetical protein
MFTISEILGTFWIADVGVTSATTAAIAYCRLSPALSPDKKWAWEEADVAP